MFKKIIVSEKEQGKYKAFPTIVKVQGEYIVAFREGFEDPNQPHGRNGRVKFLKSKDLNKWKEIQLDFCDNELDAIISGPFNNYLFLVTRSFEYRKRNDVYISKFKIGELPQERKLLRFEEIAFTCFGHITKDKDELVMTAYGHVKGVQTPIIFSSQDWGETWEYKSSITPKGFKPILNETTYVYYQNKYFAMMRSHEKPYYLYYSSSENLINWTNPVKSSIKGHAPMLKTLKNGKVAMVFRDLNDHKPGIGLAITDDFVNWNKIVLTQYNGGLYEGGYADFYEFEENKLFIVYYIADEDNWPWIEATIVDIEKI